MSEKLGIDAFLQEYKELEKEVAALRKEQQQQTRLMANLVVWLIKIPAQNQSADQVRELIQIVSEYVEECQETSDFCCPEFLNKLNQIVSSAFPPMPEVPAMQDDHAGGR